MKDTRKILKHLNSINLLRSSLLPTEEFHLHEAAYVIQEFYVSSLYETMSKKYSLSQ